METEYNPYTDNFDYVADPAVVNVTPEPVTFLQLDALITASGLTVGKQYLITDFRTIHNFILNGVPSDQVNTGPVEPLIVKAISVNALAPYADSPAYPRDIIWYDPSMKTTEYISAPTARPGKITFRIETRRNVSAWEDFRAVKVLRYEATTSDWDEELTYEYCNVVAWNGALYKAIDDVPAGVEPGTDDYNYWIKYIDYSNNDGFRNFFPFDSGMGIGNSNTVLTFINPVIYPMFCRANGTFTLPSNISIGRSTTLSNNLFIIPAGSNFGSNSINGVNNTFYGDLRENTTGYAFNTNIFYGSGTEQNTIGENFSNNIIGGGFRYNNTMPSFMKNCIEEQCWYNNFGIEFVYNDVGSDFGNNVTDADTFHTRFGAHVWANHFGYYTESTFWPSYSRGIHALAGNVAQCRFPKLAGTIFECGLVGKDLRAYAILSSAVTCKISAGEGDTNFIEYKNSAGVNQVINISAA